MAWDLRKNSLYIKISAIILTFVLLVILISQISIQGIISTITSINLIYLIFAFFLYVCSHFLRTLRFYILLDKKIGFISLFWIICAHNMFNTILPARTGEFSYIFLIKSRHDIKITEGIATLVLSRLFDFIAIVSIFFIALLTQNQLPGVILGGIWLIFLILAGSLGLLCILLFYGPNSLKLCTSLSGKLHLDTYKPWKYLLDKGVEVVGYLEQLKGKKIIVPSMMISLLNWICLYSFLYILLIGMHLSLPVQNVILGGTFVVLTTVLPIHGIAGFGTTEGIWTLVFVALGMSLDEAILSGFSYHIISLVYTCILGLSALSILRKEPGNKPEQVKN